MKQFYGVTNLQETLLARVLISEDSRAFAGPCLLEKTLADKPFSQFKANLPFFLVSNGEIPTEGDIVLLEPSGVATILFEVDCPDNAIMLTEKCNSRCIMCPQPPKDFETEEKKLQTALKIIELMPQDTRVIGITGGEPTLVWESLLKILKACVERSPSMLLELLTNGRILKTFYKAEDLRQVCSSNLIAAIPLYADYDALHDRHSGVKGSFWETIEGIYNLQRVGIAVELRIVMTRLNYKRISKWAEFIYKTFPFAAHIVFMELEPVGYASRNIDTLWVEPEEYMAFLEEAVSAFHRRNMKVSIYNCQLCNLSHRLWRFSRKSISSWKATYISECSYCSVKPKCGGFFQSAQILKARNLVPLSFYISTSPDSKEAQNG